MRNLLLVIVAAVLLSLGWLGVSGLPMLVALVPMLVVAGRMDSSKRSFWRMAGWTGLFIALWYGLTVWWVWYATPVGPIAAVFFAWVYTGLGMMAWFWLSKRAPKSLSYTFLVAAWMVGEWVYNASQASFPWLALGSGFARDVWAVQWYEFTGTAGGTLWVLVVNVLVYEFVVLRLFPSLGPKLGGVDNSVTTDLRPKPAKGEISAPPHPPKGGADGLQRKPGWISPLLAVVVPIAVSLAMYWGFDEPERTAQVTIVQPNVDPWVGDYSVGNLVSLVMEAPGDADFIVMPETAIDENVWEGHLAQSSQLRELRAAVSAHPPAATLVLGATTLRSYGARKATHTARGTAESGFFDVYNSAIALDSEGRATIHHKAKLVAGAEMMPTWWWVQGIQRLFSDLEFYVGQYGFGDRREVFTSGGGVSDDGGAGGGADTISDGIAGNAAGDTAGGGADSIAEPIGYRAMASEITAGAAICWESVFGEYFTEFVLNGAQVMFVITNDGWWRDTPGYRQHFDYSRLRAIETRRAVARSANTGRSGFITARGDVRQTLGWQERGAITERVGLNDRLTFYVRFGDWLSRISLLVLGLCVLYFIVYRVRRRG